VFVKITAVELDAKNEEDQKVLLANACGTVM
jgi:hypothetical protein